MNVLQLKRTAAVLLAVMTLCPRSPVRAEGDTVTTVNHIGTGNVSISLNEYRLSADGTETPIEGNSDRRTVLPGDTVSKISKITVNGHKSWIRAKVMTEGDSRITTLSPAWVRLFEDDAWLHKGDYWYYIRPVDHGATIRFTKEVKVPTEADASNAVFHVILWADAVQYDNFKPNFNAADPWFGTVIEESAYQTFRYRDPEDAHFFVSYEGGAQGLIANSGDLFHNFAVLMPGDHVSDSLVIGNGYTQPVRLFFRVEATGEERKLAERIKLNIHAGETKIYSGTLADAMNEIYLAWMTPNWTAVLTYELDVPEDLKNEFELTDTSDRWIFRAELSPVRRIIPNTGDPTHVGTYAAGLVLSVLAAAGAAFLLRKYRGRQG